MFGAPKKDKPVKFTTDSKGKAQAKQRRVQAAEEARVQGKEVKETRKGVQETNPKTKRGQADKAARERINKLAGGGVIDYGTTKKGSKSE